MTLLHVALPVVLVGVMPYALTMLSKSRGFTANDNKQTRVWQGQLTGWQQRAYWAHQNGFEALPLFAALVILAHLGHAGSTIAAAAAWAFVALRVVYSALYIADLGSARSLAWFGGQAAQAALLLVALGVVA